MVLVKFDYGDPVPAPTEKQAWVKAERYAELLDLEQDFRITRPIIQRLVDWCNMPAPDYDKLYPHCEWGDMTDQVMIEQIAEALKPLLRHNPNG